MKKTIFIYIVILISASLGAINSYIYIYNNKGYFHNFNWDKVDFCFSTFCLVIIITLRKYIIFYLESLFSWIDSSNFKYQRSIVFYFSLFFLLSFITRITLGFWYPGIRGWDYSSYSTSWKVLGHVNNLTASKSPEFLLNSINIDNLKFLPESDALIDGNAIFMHFTNGSTLPTNKGILNVVFPEYILNYNNNMYDKNIIDIIKFNLKQKQKSKKCFVPDILAYPVHTKYCDIDYSNYPDPESLKALSFWDYKIKTFASGNFEIINAKERRLIGNL